MTEALFFGYGAKGSPQPLLGGLVMSTPDEDVLREHAIEQIAQQIEKEFLDQNKTLPSKAAMRLMAKKRHDEEKHLT